MQNQTLTVAIGNHRFEIEHQTMMGNLNEVWDCGNAYRTQKGLPPKLLANWLRSADTAEYVAVVEKDLLGFKSVVTTQLESTTGLVDTITKTSPLFKTRRGRLLTQPWLGVSTNLSERFAYPLRPMRVILI